MQCPDLVRIESQDFHAFCAGLVHPADVAQAGRHEEVHRAEPGKETHKRPASASAHSAWPVLRRRTIRFQEMLKSVLFTEFPEKALFTGSSIVISRRVSASPKGFSRRVCKQCGSVMGEMVHFRDGITSGR